MREKAIKDWPLALRVLLVGVLLAMWAGVGVVYADTPDPVRSLPEAVAPGQEFEVTVTFTAPEDGFTIISLSDRAPDGWTVSVNTAWCTPVAELADTPYPDLADYLWGMSDLPYEKGTPFTAVYRVQVPVDVEPGEYTFQSAGFQYFIEVNGTLTGPFAADMGGDDQIVVAQYDLTIDSTEGGEVTVPGEGTFTYAPGTAVDLLAVPHDHYRFVGWTGDIGTIADATSANTTITIEDDYSITAVFELVDYNLTIDSTEGGEVTVPGEDTFTYAPETVVDLLAVPDEHYRFVGWTGDIGTIADATSANTTITMQDDYSITASFGLVDYNLTIDSTEGGSVTVPGEDMFTYTRGTVVNLVAVPDEHYRFVGWTGDIDEIDDVTSADTTITMWGDYSITAVFELVDYDLTIDSTEGGSVTVPGEDTYTYVAGTVVDLLAVPEARYRFVEWTGSIGTIADATSANTTITMEGDYSITAVFETLTWIQGQTREARCHILPGVTVTLYLDDDEIAIASTVSDEDGYYALAVPDLGNYTVVAGRDGFRNEEKSITITEYTTYTADFAGDHGLIPNAPTIGYVGLCIAKWREGQLTIGRVGQITAAWRAPITG